MTTTIDRLSAIVDEERSRALGWGDKAVQPAWYGLSTEEIVETAPTLDELSTPMMTLDRRLLDANLQTMARWCADHDLSLAPHGKTTMAPALWLDQLRAGSWAISVANEPQLRVARGAGLSRIILANLFLRPDGLEWLSGELAADPEFEFFCWVDSVEAVRIMDAALRSVPASRPVRVLVERGDAGARTGARDLDTALRVAEAVLASSTLALAGVSGFEGSVAHGQDDASLAAVDNFLGELVQLHRALLGRYEVEEAVLTAGGSAYFDRVAKALAPERDERIRVVLRSGAYLVHDDGYYREATPSTRAAGPHFFSAMHVWSRVLSMPEPGLAYLDAGKRDVPYDDGLPEPQLARRVDADGSILTFPLTGHELFETNDQHSFVRVPSDSPLRVGDVVRLGLSHPCTAFDKWSLIPVLDGSSAESPVVVDLIRTRF